MSLSSSLASRDFSSKTLRTLGKRGVSVVGVQALPGCGDMPWSNAERGYVVAVNGQARVWTFTQVLEASK